MATTHLCKLTNCNLASFISIYTKFSRVLSAQMASHLVLEKFWLESVASKNFRMHAGMDGDEIISECNEM